MNRAQLAGRIRISTRRPPRPSEQAAEEPQVEEADSDDEAATETDASAPRRRRPARSRALTRPIFDKDSANPGNGHLSVDI